MHKQHSCPLLTKTQAAQKRLTRVMVNENLQPRPISRTDSKRPQLPRNQAAHGEGPNVQKCYAFLNGNCSRNKCKYAH